VAASVGPAPLTVSVTSLRSFPGPVAPSYPSGPGREASKALRRWAGGTPTQPTLCALHQGGGCNGGPKCNQVHVDRGRAPASPPGGREGGGALGVKRFPETVGIPHPHRRAVFFPRVKPPYEARTGGGSGRTRLAAGPRGRVHVRRAGGPSGAGLHCRRWRGEGGSTLEQQRAQVSQPPNNIRPPQWSEMDTEVTLFQTTAVPFGAVREGGPGSRVPPPCQLLPGPWGPRLPAERLPRHPLPAQDPAQDRHPPGRPLCEWLDVCRDSGPRRRVSVGGRLVGMFRTHVLVDPLIIATIPTTPTEFAPWALPRAPPPLRPPGPS